MNSPALLLPIYQADEANDGWQTADDRVMGGGFIGYALVTVSI